MKTKLTGNWNRQKDPKCGDDEEDIQLCELMKAVRHYIRSIDVNRL